MRGHWAGQAVSADSPLGQAHEVQCCAAVPVAHLPWLVEAGRLVGGARCRRRPWGQAKHAQQRTLVEERHRRCTLSSSCFLPCARNLSLLAAVLEHLSRGKSHHSTNSKCLVVGQHRNPAYRPQMRLHAPVPDVPAPPSPTAAPSSAEPSAAAAPAAPALMRCSAAMRACSLAKAASGGPETLGPGPDPDGKAELSPAAVTGTRPQRAAGCG